MNTMTKIAGRAMAVAMLVMLAMVAPAHAQFEDTDNAEAVMYLNDRTEQGITVVIEPLGKPSPEISHGDAMLLVIDDEFLEAFMDGYLVLDSEEFDDEAVETIGAGAGKLFAVIDEETLASALVLVLVVDDDLIMIGYLGFSGSEDMLDAVAFAQDVAEDGIEADPPKGFVEID
jgi:hypothetical protein